MADVDLMPSNGLLIHMERCLLFSVLLDLSPGLGLACDLETGPGMAGIAPKPAESSPAMPTFTYALKRGPKTLQEIQRLNKFYSPAVEMARALLVRGENTVARSGWAARPPQMSKLPSLGPIIRPDQELVRMPRPGLIAAEMHFKKHNAQNSAIREDHHGQRRSAARL